MDSPSEFDQSVPSREVVLSPTASRELKPSYSYSFRLNDKGQIQVAKLAPNFNGRDLGGLAIEYCSLERFTIPGSELEGLIRRVEAVLESRRGIGSGKEVTDPNDPLLKTPDGDLYKILYPLLEIQGKLEKSRKKSEGH